MLGKEHKAASFKLLLVLIKKKSLLILLPCSWPEAAFPKKKKKEKEKSQLTSQSWQRMIWKSKVRGWTFLLCVQTQDSFLCNLLRSLRLSSPSKMVSILCMYLMGKASHRIGCCGHSQYFNSLETAAWPDFEILWVCHWDLHPEVWFAPSLPLPSLSHLLPQVISLDVG